MAGLEKQFEALQKEHESLSKEFEAYRKAVVRRLQIKMEDVLTDTRKLKDELEKENARLTTENSFLKYKLNNAEAELRSIANGGSISRPRFEDKD